MELGILTVACKSCVSWHVRYWRRPSNSRARWRSTTTSTPTPACTARRGTRSRCLATSPTAAATAPSTAASSTTTAARSARRRTRRWVAGTTRRFFRSGRSRWGAGTVARCTWGTTHRTTGRRFGFGRSRPRRRASSGARCTWGSRGWTAARARSAGRLCFPGRPRRRTSTARRLRRLSLAHRGGSRWCR